MANPLCACSAGRPCMLACATPAPQFAHAALKYEGRTHLLGQPLRRLCQLCMAQQVVERAVVRRGGARKRLLESDVRRQLSVQLGGLLLES